ncbi:hypothetical protein BGZ63DRAFT_150603 [Mariannaea sp. PMI_226]|nr:hypothetical protein BGZ63DRAFT_150603 [Mariannaea sp. PMI_226]
MKHGMTLAIFVASECRLGVYLARAGMGLLGLLLCVLSNYAHNSEQDSHGPQCSSYLGAKGQKTRRSKREEKKQRKLSHARMAILGIPILNQCTERDAFRARVRETGGKSGSRGSRDSGAPEADRWPHHQGPAIEISLFHLSSMHAVFAYMLWPLRGFGYSEWQNLASIGNMHL